MPLLKSLPHIIKIWASRRLSLVYLLVFCIASLLISFGAELFFHVKPRPLCLTQRYLVILIAFNAFVGSRSLFKNSYVITCKILLIVLFITALTHTSIQLGLIGHLSSLQTENSEISKLLQDPRSFFYTFRIPLSLFNVVGACLTFWLLDPLVKTARLRDKE